MNHKHVVSFVKKELSEDSGCRLYANFNSALYNTQGNSVNNKEVCGK